MDNKKREEALKQRIVKIEEEQQEIKKYIKKLLEEKLLHNGQMKSI